MMYSSCTENTEFKSLIVTYHRLRYKPLVHETHRPLTIVPLKTHSIITKYTISLSVNIQTHAVYTSLQLSSPSQRVHANQIQERPAIANNTVSCCHKCHMVYQRIARFVCVIYS